MAARKLKLVPKANMVVDKTPKMPLYNPASVVVFAKPTVVVPVKTLEQHRLETLAICRKLREKAPHFAGNTDRIKFKVFGMPAEEPEKISKIESFLILIKNLWKPESDSISVETPKSVDLADMEYDDITNTMSQLSKWEQSLLSGLKVGKNVPA